MILSVWQQLKCDKYRVERRQALSKAYGPNFAHAHKGVIQSSSTKRGIYLFL